SSAESTATQYSYNSFNQLTTKSQSAAPFAVTNFGYDNNGNLLSETTGTQVKSYTWDLDNRLRQVTLPGGATNLFDYAANGLRIRKNDSTGTTGYLLDGPSALEELSPSGSTVTSYLTNPRAIDEIDSFQQAGTTYYPLSDALGSIYAIADSAGAIVRTNSYDVYGSRSTFGTGPQIAQGFATLWHEPDTGQARARQRTFDQGRGVWLSADPLRLVAGPNYYLSVRANPVMFVDPSGTDIAVIENGPTQGNPIGHTAIAVSQFGVFSFGNDTPIASSLKQYVLREAPRRGSVIDVIPTTLEQDL